MCISGDKPNNSESFNTTFQNKQIQYKKRQDLFVPVPHFIRFSFEFMTVLTSSYYDPVLCISQISQPRCEPIIVTDEKNILRRWILFKKCSKEAFNTVISYLITKCTRRSCNEASISNYEIDVKKKERKSLQKKERKGSDRM